MSNIVRVPAATAGTVPAGGADYQKQNDLLYTFGLWGMGTYPLDLTNNKVVKGAVFNVGGVLYRATADEGITGTSSKYVKITRISAGAECSAAYVASLTGVSWSDTYNGYVDGSGELYLFDEARALYDGAISFAHTSVGRIQYIGGALSIKGALTGSSGTFSGQITADKLVIDGGGVNIDGPATFESAIVPQVGIRHSDLVEGTSLTHNAIYDAVVAITGSSTQSLRASGFYKDGTDIGTIVAMGVNSTFLSVFYVTGSGDYTSVAILNGVGTVVDEIRLFF